MTPIELFVAGIGFGAGSAITAFVVGLPIQAVCLFMKGSGSKLVE